MACRYRVGSIDYTEGELIEMLDEKYGASTTPEFYDYSITDNFGEKETINEQKALSFLTSLFGESVSVKIFETAKRVGNGYAQGYYNNACIHLWKSSEVGTEYHEAFHGVFNLFLGTEEKNTLYSEARSKYGEATSEQLSKLKELYPSYSVEQLNNLATEEILADKFKEYSLLQDKAGIVGKILNYFKNLYQYIKSLVSNKTSIDSAFANIKTARINKTLLRENEKFATDTRYSLKKGYTSTLQKHVENALVERALNSLKQFEQEGTPFSIKSVLTDVYNSFVRQRDQILGEEFPLAKTEKERTRLTFIANEISKILDPKVWNTQYDFYSNVKEEGFSTILLRMMADFGYSIPQAVMDSIEKKASKFNDSETKPSDLDESVEFLEDVLAERIYGKAVFENNPSSSMPKELRKMLSLIEDKSTPNLFGSKVYHNSKTVYDSLSILLANSRTYSEMMDKLATGAKYNPIYKQVKAIIDLKSDNDKALFFVNFSNTYNKFLTGIRETVKDEAGNSTSDITYFDTDQNSYEKRSLEKWKINSRSKEDSLYHYVGDKLEVSETKVAEMLNLLKDINLNTRDSKKGTPIYDKNVENFHKFLTITGVDISLENFKTIIDQGIVSNGKTVQGTHLLHMLIHPSVLNNNGGASYAIPNEELRGDIDIYNSGVTFLTSITKLTILVDKVNGVSFLSASGKSIYPINMPAIYDLVFENLKNGLEDDSIYHQEACNKDSLFVKYFTKSNEDEGEKVRNEFAWRILDAAEVVERDEKKLTTELTKTETIVHRLNLFLNKGHKAKTSFVFRTMGGRGRQVIIDSLRISEMARLEGKPVERFYMDTLLNFVKQDLEGIAQANADIASMPYSELIDGYHFSSKAHAKAQKKENELAVEQKREPEILTLESGKFKGSAFSLRQLSFLSDQKIFNDRGDLVSITNYRKDLALSPENITRMSEIFDIYEGEINNYIEFRTLEILDKLGDSKELINDLSGKYANIKELVREYVIEDIIFQNEINRFTAVDYGFYDSHETYSKRLETFGTPGTRNYVENGGFGLKKTFSNSFIEDLPYEEADLVELEAGFKEYFKNDPEKLKFILKKYKDTNGTDASGYCTIGYWKGLLESKGKWSPEMEEAYRNYNNPSVQRFAVKKGDSYHDVHIVPVKTYYDGRNRIGNKTSRVIIKHGILPLLRDTIKKNSRLKALHDRMNLEDKYAPGKTLNKKSNLEPIDTVNTRTTAKAAIVGVESIADSKDLSHLKVHKFTTEGLVEPQVIPSTHEENLWASQVRKNIIEGLIEGVDYTLPKGVVTDKDGIKSLYTSVGAKMIEDSKDTLFERFGFSKVVELRNEFSNKQEVSLQDQEDYARANFKMLVNLRDFINSQATDKELTENYRKLMDIGMNPVTGLHEFNTPLWFPSYMRKTEQLINSAFKNNILSQQINGTSAVQIADLGGAFESSDLKMPIYNADGTVTPGEIAISYEYAQKLGFTEGDISEDNPALRGVCYRIPNAGKNMMMPFRIKYILPEGQSTCVMVPKGITTQMGSDFDIDKLYIMYPNVTKQEDGSYGKKEVDYSKAFTEVLGKKIVNKEFLNSLNREELENAIIDISYTILTTPAHYGEMMSPLDTDTLPDAVDRITKHNNDEFAAYYESKKNEVANDLAIGKITEQEAQVKRLYYDDLKRKAESGKLDRNNVLDEDETADRNNVASVLTGISANNTTGLAVGEYAGLHLSDNVRVHIKGNLEYLKELDPIKNVKGLGKESEGLVSTTHSENLSSALDNAKKAMAYILRDTAVTSPIKTFLTSLGSGNDILANYFNQPIIIKLLDYLSQNSKVDLYNACNEIAALYKMPNFSLLPAKFIYLDPELLNSTISNFLPKIEGTKEEDIKAYNSKMEKQSEYLHYFYHLTNLGKEMTKMHKVLNADRISDLSSSGAVQEFIDMTETLLNSSNILGLREYFEQDLHALQIAFFKQGILATKQIDDLLFPFNHSGLKDAKDKIATYTKKQYLNADDHKLVNMHVFQWLLTQEGSPLKPFNNIEYKKALFQGDKSLDIRLAEIKAKYKGINVKGVRLDNNSFLNLLIAHPMNYGGKSVLKRIKANISASYNAKEKDDFINDFTDLYTHPDQVVRDFADDMVRAMLFSSGFNISADSFIEFMPLKYWAEKGYISFFKANEQLFNQPLAFEGFIEEYIQNNASREGIVPYNKSAKGAEWIAISNKDRSIINVDSGKYTKYIKGVDKNFNTVLYKFSHLTTSGEGKHALVYTRIPTRGIKYQLLEYGVRTEKDRLTPEYFKVAKNEGKELPFNNNKDIRKMFDITVTSTEKLTNLLNTFSEDIKDDIVTLINTKVVNFENGKLTTKDPILKSLIAEFGEEEGMKIYNTKAEEVYSKPQEAEEGSNVKGIEISSNSKGIRAALTNPIDNKIIPLDTNFSRNSAQQDSDYIYLFTDNAKRTSGRNSLDYNSAYSKKYTTSYPLNYPTMTQAVIRGLNNAFPITTMVDDNRTQWKDSQFEEYKKIIDDEIETIRQARKNFKGIKFAAQMPFGKGKISNMKVTAPKIFTYMTSKLAEIGIDNTGEVPKIIKEVEIKAPTKIKITSEQLEQLNTKFALGTTIEEFEKLDSKIQEQLLKCL